MMDAEYQLVMERITECVGSGMPVFLDRNLGVPDAPLLEMIRRRVNRHVVTDRGEIAKLIESPMYDGIETLRAHLREQLETGMIICVIMPPHIRPAFVS